MVYLAVEKNSVLLNKILRTYLIYAVYEVRYISVIEREEGERETVDGVRRKKRRWEGGRWSCRWDEGERERVVIGKSKAADRGVAGLASASGFK